MIVRINSVSIADGQSLSTAASLGYGDLCGINMPALWTPADLTFQGSIDGVTFQNLYNADGTELTVKAAAGRFINIPLRISSAPWIKVRSGTSAAPVIQTAAASAAISLVIQKVAPGLPGT